MSEGMTDKSGGEQDRLIEALARQVPFEGWGEKALAHAAAAEGIDPVLAADLLPGGARAQVLAFAAWADRQMTAALAAAAPPAEGEHPGIRERIAAALKARFAALQPHREAVRRGLAVLALPHNAAAGLAALHRTADAIWTALGDSSTDWNWYSKRLLLAGVLSATTLYWLEDKSEGHQRTWAFLDRQLESVVKLGGKLGQAVKRALSFPDRVVAKGMKMARRSYGA
jgi:ubiquinone biosynthesis protein COQ9